MRLAQTEATNSRNRSTVTLKRNEASGIPPISLTVYALPPTYVDDAEVEIPSPTPPVKGWVRDRKGRLDKDGRGRPIKNYDEDDPEYQKQLRVARQLQSVKMVYDALDPTEITFETSRDGKTPAAYYAGIREELMAFGFSVGDLVTLVQAVTETSGLDEEMAERARADFFETED